MKAPTTIQTRYTVNFCEPIRWEKVSSLERDMNHNTAMKGRRPNRDDEINNRPVNKKISHIGCSILDWNNAFDPQQSIFQMNWIQLEWILIYLIQSSFMPCRFQTIQETYQTWKIIFRITWDRNAPSFATGSDIDQRKECQVGFTSEGKTLQISCEIVSNVNI